jgi:hypothetical protein
VVAAGARQIADWLIHPRVDDEDAARDSLEPLKIART